MITRSAEILIELEAILKANPILSFVGVGKVIPIAQETNNSAAYILLNNSIPRSKGTSPEIDNYDFSGFILISVNVDCTNNKYLIHDVVDSIQRSILNDQTVWLKIVDRDILSVEYDNAEFSPKRSAIVALEVTYRLNCN